jgi:hypothetical protein
MTNRKSIKQQITEAVLAEIPKHLSTDHELLIEDVIFKWWSTGRQDGLRLTDRGVAAFTLAEIAYYDFPLVQEGQSYHSFLLELTKKIRCPYYLNTQKNVKPHKPYIRFYDSKIAMMMSLYGDLESYLASVKTPR